MKLFHVYEIEYTSLLMQKSNIQKKQPQYMYLTIV